MNTLLTEAELSAMLKIKVGTLRQWRCTSRTYRQGDNPLPYIKCGRLVRYRLDDVQAWLNRCITNTKGK